MNANQYLTIDGRSVPIEGEPNLLEVIRKANIDIPTFCYHSSLSVYGACRLCLVDVEGRGLVASCSTKPEPGMVVRTATEEIREMRKITVELLLANHDQSCLTCSKSGTCQLQDLARRLGVEEVRFRPTLKPVPVDRTSPSLVRDPNKCVLCGDCVRACAEIQGIGAIDFIHRGAKSAVAPAFGKDLNLVECVYCGQCAAVCPTGALTPKSEVSGVWQALHDGSKTVIAQIAPAVRVGLGEHFGMKAGSVVTGQIAAALKMMGFDQVYDTSFAADLTVLEEAEEFIARKQKGERLPQFTSCCPAWVKYAEQYYSDLLPNLSSCRSPQQMFGALAKDTLPEKLGVEREDIVIVSIMPCTAKKYEKTLAKFSKDGVPDVDFVLTTQELAHMIEESGFDFDRIEPASLDMPFGFRTGAGVIFGASGGVTEAVLRYAAEKLSGCKLDSVDFHEVRGEEGLREAVVPVGGIELKLAIVHGLANAKRVAAKVRSGEAEYDLVEVMACPGGCVGGAGQPVAREQVIRKLRAKGLHNADKMLQLHKSQDNYVVTECYEKHLGSIGGHKAHELLHTEYQSRRRVTGTVLPLFPGGSEKLSVKVCVGTNCYVKGSQDLLRALLRHVEAEGLEDRVDVQATFCLENCSQAPNVAIGDEVIGKATFEKVVTVMGRALERVDAGAVA